MRSDNCLLKRVNELSDQRRDEFLMPYFVIFLGIVIGYLLVVYLCAAS